MYAPCKGQTGGSFVFLCLVILMSVHCCLVGTCWEMADLLALVGDVYCIFVTLHVVSWSGVVIDCIVPDLCRLSYFANWLDWLQPLNNFHQCVRSYL